MPGRKLEFDMTYLTALSTYRSNILSADPTPDDDSIPAIRLDIDDSKLAIDAKVEFAPRREVSARAYNGHLELYVQFDAGEDCVEAPQSLISGLLSQEDARCHADILVWAWGEPLDSSLEGRWCLVHEQSVVTDTLIPIRNIPNTKYKVTVSFMNGTGTRVDILEQHTV